MKKILDISSEQLGKKKFIANLPIHNYYVYQYQAFTKYSREYFCMQVLLYSLQKNDLDDILIFCDCTSKEQIKEIRYFRNANNDREITDFAVRLFVQTYLNNKYLIIDENYL